MRAILITLGTKYACNLIFNRDHICLQCRKFLKHLESDRLGSKSYFKKIEISGIYGPQQKLLQVYMVPITTKIASIIDPPLYWRLT